MANKEEASTEIRIIKYERFPKCLNRVLYEKSIMKYVDMFLGCMHTMPDVKRNIYTKGSLGANRHSR